MRMRKVAGALAVVTSFVVCVAGLGAGALGETQPRHPEASVRQDAARFQEAYRLIQEGRYDAALPLLEQNMAETPGATDLDYAYGWAVVCAAHLGDVDKTLTYYKVVRTRFGGWQRSGAGGAHRTWESNLDMARRAVKAGRVVEKERVLKQLDELDRLGREHAVRELKALIRRVQAGDQVAVDQLRGTSHIQPFIDLIVEGELKLVEEQGPGN